MSGIFTRCWQVGRRFLWPHLLFGMVAASVGLPGLLADMHASVATHKPQSGARAVATGDAAARFDLTFSDAPWQRHIGFPAVVRHWSYSLAPQSLPFYSRQPILASSLALPGAAQALWVSVRGYSSIHIAGFGETSRLFRLVSWISQARGIRAGPAVF